VPGTSICGYKKLQETMLRSRLLPGRRLLSVWILLGDAVDHLGTAAAVRDIKILAYFANTQNFLLFFVFLVLVKAQEISRIPQEFPGGHPSV
jgi:uncharacterized membrane protein